jgi:hypothetical protein
MTRLWTGSGEDVRDDMMAPETSRSGGRDRVSRKPSPATISTAQLSRFIRRRNRSSLQTNLQFGADANACGFPVAALGPARSFMLAGLEGFLWTVPTGDGGTVRLVEYCSTLWSDRDPDAKKMFDFLGRVVFQ